MESNGGYVSCNLGRYVLAGRQGVDDHVLAAGDVLELSTSGRCQAVRVASGGYRGWYYVTADGQRGRFALGMKARLVGVGLWIDDVCVLAGVCSAVNSSVIRAVVFASVRKGGGPMTTANIEMSVQGNTLVITVDLSKTYGLSASGKSEVIASTGGNISVPGREQVKVGLNIYRPQK
jgi:hypothetical protein